MSASAAAAPRKIGRKRVPTLEFKGKPFVYSHHLSVPLRQPPIDVDKTLLAPSENSLTAQGADENTSNLCKRVARGRYANTIFAQCMVALNVKELRVPGKDDLYEAIGCHGGQALAPNPSGKAERA
jgi:hypothetical protein